MMLLLILMVSKSIIANSVSTFFIKGKPTFLNGSKTMQQSPPDFTILDSLMILY